MTPTGKFLNTSNKNLTSTTDGEWIDIALRTRLHSENRATIGTAVHVYSTIKQSEMESMRGWTGFVVTCGGGE